MVVGALAVVVFVVGVDTVVVVVVVATVGGVANLAHIVAAVVVPRVPCGHLRNLDGETKSGSPLLFFFVIWGVAGGLVG